MNPNWPSPTSPYGRVFFTNAETFHQMLLTHYGSNIVAIAMLVQFEAESGCNPNAMGDYLDADGKPLRWSPHPVGTPTSFGGLQRKAPRTNIIRDGLAAKGIAGLGFDIQKLAMANQNTVANDALATIFELDNFPMYGLGAIKVQSTAGDAAYEAAILYERMGTKGAAYNRKQLAPYWEGYFADFGRTQELSK